MIRILISGGQTGVDRAALDYAIGAGLLCSGWCPKGRIAEDGIIPSHYPLVETPESTEEQRTEWNVRDTDGTLIIVDGPPDEGTAYTVEMAYKYEKPFYMVNLTQNAMPDIVDHWLRRFKVQILNIAGPRESNCPGIYDRASTYLNTLFEFLALPEEQRAMYTGEENGE